MLNKKGIALNVSFGSEEAIGGVLQVKMLLKISISESYF